MSENERVAKLELRADKHDESLSEMRQCMQSLSKSMNELVRLQVQQSAYGERLQQLETRLDNEVIRRQSQHEETRQWADHTTGLSRVNSSWIDWGKTILVALLATIVTVGATHLLTGMSVA